MATNMNYDLNSYYSNSKFWYIIYILAILSWLVTIITTSVTNIDPKNFLGIISRLPIYFYIAIFLTIISTKYAYDHNNLTMLSCGLFILITILFLTYPLIEPNASYSVAYYPSGMAKQILEKGHMSTEFNDKGYVYLYYPGLQIFTSVLVSMSNLSLGFIVKYFHFLFIFIIIMFIVLAYKLLSKNWEFALVGSFFFSVFLWSEQTYYGPQLFAFTFLSVLYMILMKYIEKRDNSLVIIAILTFLVINSSHLLSSFMIVSFLFVLYMIMNIERMNVGRTIIKRAIIKGNLKLKYFFMPFSTIFLSWLIYMAIPFFKYSVRELLKSFNTVDTYVTGITLQRSIIGETVNQTVVFNTRLLFIILDIVLSIIAIYLYLKNKNEYNNFNIPIIWIISTVPLFLTVYGGEIIQRIYLYSLIGTIFFITYLFVRTNRSVVIFSILLILAILHPIAFAGDKALKLISDSEMSGDIFLSKMTPKQDIKVFYIGGGPILKYISPSNRYIDGIWFPPRKQINLTKKYDYIIQSEIGVNGLYYYLDYDPLSEQISKISPELYKIYDNKNFLIYKKIKNR